MDFVKNKTMHIQFNFDQLEIQTLFQGDMATTVVYILLLTHSMVAYIFMPITKIWIFYGFTPKV